MANILPQAVTQFVDDNGHPYAGGFVYFYIPNTTTPKAVWMDAAQTVLQTNPVVLDGAGRAIIFGSGAYRQQLYDVNMNLIWDQLTYSPVSSSDLSGTGVPGGAGLIGFDGTTLDQQFKSRVDRVVDSISQLRAISKTTYTRVHVTGYYSAGDGGGGFYWYDPSDTTSSDNSGSLIVASDGGRWKLEIIGGFVTPKQFGAKGDWNGTTGTDDTVAMQAALSAAVSSDLWIDGAGGFYKLLSNVTVTGTSVRMRNFKFALGPNYTTQATITLNVTNAELRSIYTDGGRGTYKTGNETWVSFASNNGYTSIQPSFNPFITIAAYTASARIVIDSVSFDNMFAVACINIGTYGTVQIDNCSYRNIANCTYTVYHSPDNGTTVAGRTEVNNVYAENVGILPSTFNVNGTPTNFGTSTSFPQGSFNFLVSFGDYVLNNAVVWNYAACGFTADRNTTFNGNNIYVLCDNPNAVSNNPSGAMWNEACKKFTLSNAVANIQARDPRDYTGAGQESSALQLFLLEDAQCELNNVVIKGNTTSAVSNRAIRISSSATTSTAGNEINATNIHVDGLYSSGNAMTAFLGANTVVGTKYRFANMNITAGNVVLDPMRIMEFSQSFINGSITMQPAGNPGVTGSVAIFGVRESNTGAIAVTCAVPGVALVDNNEIVSGNINIANCTGQASVSGNTAITGSITLDSLSSTAGAFKVVGNAQISGVTSVPHAKSAIVNSNMTYRRMEVLDVQTFEIVGNTGKTDQPESIVLVNPTVPANVLAGVISSNNLLVKTGTVGAGFVTLAGGVVNVTDVNNNKLTVNWS